MYRRPGGESTEKNPFPLSKTWSFFLFFEHLCFYVHMYKHSYSVQLSTRTRRRKPFSFCYGRVLVAIAATRSSVKLYGLGAHVPFVCKGEWDRWFSGECEDDTLRCTAAWLEVRRSKYTQINYSSLDLSEASDRAMNNWEIRLMCWLALWL